MKNIDPKTPIWRLTVEEFLEVSKNINSEKKYEFGLKGLAKNVGMFYFESLGNKIFRTVR